MKRVESFVKLKTICASTDGIFTDLFIQLNFGLRSSKRVLYNPETNTFDVHNEIDDSYQDDLTEEQLTNETHIIEALHLGALYQYD